MKEKRKQIKEVHYLKKKDISKIRNYFLKKDKIIILSLIDIGLNTGLRISDLLALKFEDIKNNIAKKLEVKTNKIKNIYFNAKCLEALENLKRYYLKKNMLTNGFLFKSLIFRKKAISYAGVEKYLKLAERDLNIPYSIGSHSLRKTWGYNVYNQTKDIALLMTAFNHSNPRVTLRYIGISTENIFSVMKKVQI